jgi:hypothetical protein
MDAAKEGYCQYYSNQRERFHCCFHPVFLSLVAMPGCGSVKAAPPGCF